MGEEFELAWEEFKVALEEWQQEVRQCTDWLGKELEGGLVEPAVGTG